MRPLDPRISIEPGFRKISFVNFWQDPWNLHYNWKRIQIRVPVGLRNQKNRLSWNTTNHCCMKMKVPSEKLRTSSCHGFMKIKVPVDKLTSFSKSWLSNVYHLLCGTVEVYFWRYKTGWKGISSIYHQLWTK